MDKLARWQKIPDSLRLRKDERQKAAEVQIGFIAQEVEQAANELNFDFHAVDKPKNANDRYGLRYAEFVPVLVKALQEEEAKIRALESENRGLKERLLRLEERLNRLENRNE
jgi:hypothetical protein